MDEAISKLLAEGRSRASCQHIYIYIYIYMDAPNWDVMEQPSVLPVEGLGIASFHQ